MRKQDERLIYAGLARCLHGDPVSLIFRPRLTRGRWNHWLVSVVRESLRAERRHGEPPAGGWLPDYGFWWCRREDWPAVRQRLVDQGVVLRGPSALTAAQAERVRLKYASGRWTQRQLADRYGVTVACIREAVRGHRPAGRGRRKEEGYGT